MSKHLTVSELKKHLKEMKEIVKYEDSKTEVFCSSTMYGPMTVGRITLETVINNTHIQMTRINEDKPKTK